jgi:RNA polymerase sigma factor (sigma-70 family)
VDGNNTWEVSTEDGFLGCYRATFAEVYGYAGLLCGSDRAAAEDLVQDVYLAALARARAGEVATISVGYLVTAVRRRQIDRWRSADRERRRLTLVHSADVAVDAAAGTGGLSPWMLAQLSDRERAAVVLRFVDDLPVARIAEEMGLGTRAAESLLGRAIRRLRREEVRDA